MKTKSREVTSIWLPPVLDKETEATAREEGRTKSEFIREAVRNYLWITRWSKIREYGSRKAEEIGLRQNDINRLVHGERNKTRTGAARRR